MMRTSDQSRDQIPVKVYEFLSLARNMGKNIGKNIGKILSAKYSTGMLSCVENFLIMLSNLQQILLKVLQKEQIKTQQKQLVIWLVIKLLTELRRFQKNS